MCEEEEAVPPQSWSLHYTPLYYNNAYKTFWQRYWMLFFSSVRHTGWSSLTECGPSMTLTMSFTWMLFCSESRATAKRLSFRLFTAWCRTVSTLPCMLSTWEHGRSTDHRTRIIKHHTDFHTLTDVIWIKCENSWGRSPQVIGQLLPGRSLSPAEQWRPQFVDLAVPAPPIHAVLLHPPQMQSLSTAASPEVRP